MQSVITTPRLFLRHWHPEDLEPFALINQDPNAMRFFPRPLARSETQTLMTKLQQHFDQHGFGFYAVELRATSEMIGFIGLQYVSDVLPCAPAVEMAWRLSSRYFGQGLATEGAAAVLEYAQSSLSLTNIVSFTTEQNLASRRVMEKIGLIYDAEADFDHPQLPDDSPLKKHVLYRSLL